MIILSKNQSNNERITSNVETQTYLHKNTQQLKKSSLHKQIQVLGQQPKWLKRVRIILEGTIFTVEINFVTTWLKFHPGPLKN